MKIGIIGAGPAGLSAAYELVKRGQDVVVFEQDPQFVGGISRTVEHHGYRFDLGGHRFFSKSREVENFWEDILGDDLIVRRRISRIFFDGKFYDYPLKPLNAFRNMGARNTALCLLDYIRAKSSDPKDIRTFEDWVVFHFGRQLYEMFFKAYTEKVWGRPCNEISADWAAQRIKGLNLFSAIKDSFGLSGRSKRKTRNGAVVKSLIDEFRYPKFGPGMLWEKVASHVTSQGGQIIMGTKVTHILHEDGKIRSIQTTGVTRESQTHIFDAVISTMPMRSLVRSLYPEVPHTIKEAAEKLHYRDFLIVALVVDAASLFPDNWIYIHDPQVKVGRIQNFGNWSSHMLPPRSRTSCVGMEYFCFEGDGLWSSTDTDLLNLAKNELSYLGLIGHHPIIDSKVVRVPKAYPVYDDDYQTHIQSIVDYLRDRASNLQLIGRNGMHRYNNQDHAIMTGFLAARNLLGEHHDLWAVNGDAEYLEEVNDDRHVPKFLKQA